MNKDKKKGNVESEGQKTTGDSLIIINHRYDLRRLAGVRGHFTYRGLRDEGKK